MSFTASADTGTRLSVGTTSLHHVMYLPQGTSSSFNNAAYDDTAHSDDDKSLSVSWADNAAWLDGVNIRDEDQGRTR